MIKPLGDRVVAKREEEITKTATGILLGDAKEKPKYAVVEAVGKDVKDIKKGDKILFKEYSATEVELDKKEFLIIKEEDILGVIT
jgi:chaperonin GroES